MPGGEVAFRTHHRVVFQSFTLNLYLCFVVDILAEASNISIPFPSTVPEIRVAVSLPDLCASDVLRGLDQVAALRFEQEWITFTITL